MKKNFLISKRDKEMLYIAILPFVFSFYISFAAINPEGMKDLVFYLCPFRKLMTYLMVIPFIMIP